MANWDLNYLKAENAREDILKYIRDYYRTKPLEVINIKDGVILPQKEADLKKCPSTWMGLGGVIDQNGDFVKMSGIKSPFREDLVFGGKYDCLEPIQQYDETVVYMGAFQPQWGHFLVEYCTRLWYSLKINNKYKIAYCGFACEKGDIQKPYLDFLRLLGIRKEQMIDIRKPTKYKRIIIPEQSFLRNQYYTKEYKNIIDTAYRNVNKKNLVPFEKIYFSRCLFIRGEKPEKECGEWEIQESFRKNGYEIISPEKLSVEEQIFYVRNCKEFVAVPGSTSDNAVFAAEGTRRVYIRKSALTVCETFQIEQMTKADRITFVDCYYTPYKLFPLGYGEGPHFMGATKEFFSYLRVNKMRDLVIITYVVALVKTWCWLTKIFINKFVEARQEVIDFYRRQEEINRIRHRIRHKIKRLLKQNKKFILYPYGYVGSVVREILDEKGISTYLLVDHYKCLSDATIHDIDILSDRNYMDYKILLCSDIKSVQHESVKKIVSEKVLDRNRIIGLF